MRVAHIAPVFPPYRGGMGTVAYQQAEALAEAGVEVTVFTPQKASPRRRPPGVAVIELPALLSKGNAACLPQVLRRAAEHDLIHLHYPFFGTAELVAARRFAGGPPLILQYQMDVIGRGWRARAFRWHRRLVLPLVLRAADAIIVTSRDYAASSFLASRLPGLETRLRVIPPGVDLRLLSPSGDRDPARRHFGGASGPTVFFLARLDRTHYFKGLHILLEAIQRLPAVRLVVGGDGNLRVHYEAQAARLGVGTRVRFASEIPDELLPAYYRAADVVALPSVDRTEAFGLVLLEAMACGTAVVASRLPGVRTLVQDGYNGYLVEPGNAADLAEKIESCLRDAPTLGANAHAFVTARFSAAVVAQQLLDLYQRLAPVSAPPAVRPREPRHRSVAAFW